MAAIGGICVAAKLELLRLLAADDCMVALYDESASLSPLTAEYIARGECKGKGYQVGGKRLEGAVVVQDGTAVCLTWSDVLWQNATISAVGALIYNKSKKNAAVVVLDFGMPYRSTNGNFKLPMPPATAAQAPVVLL